MLDEEITEGRERTVPLSNSTMSTEIEILGHKGREMELNGELTRCVHYPQIVRGVGTPAKAADKPYPGKPLRR